MLVSRGPRASTSFIRSRRVMPYSAWGGGGRRGRQLHQVTQGHAVLSLGGGGEGGGGRAEQGRAGSSASVSDIKGEAQAPSQAPLPLHMTHANAHDSCSCI